MQRKVALFSGLTGACAVAAIASVTIAATGSEKAAKSGNVVVASVEAPLVYRAADTNNTNTYGRVEVTSANAPGAVVRETPLRCSRVDFTAGRGVCLAGKGTAVVARVLDGELNVTKEIALTGLPSRTRLSPDATLASTTTFVTGDSYAAPGAFSTRTSILDLEAGRVVTSLEQLDAYFADGEKVDAPDVNYWGVTFARDDRTFYATMATAGKTYLMRGDLEAGRLDALHENVECPSLSPDGARIAYKKVVGGGEGAWHLHVLDLATMRETPLAEERQIDDQVEWLDDGNILYSLQGDTYTVPADGSGAPRLWLRGSESPAVVSS